MGEMLRVLFALPLYAVRFTVAIIRVTWKILKWLYERFKGRKSLTTHGDADWVSEKVLKKKGHFNPGSFLLLFTKPESWSGWLGWLCRFFKKPRAVYGRRNRGCIVIAGPGQGKSQNVLANFKSKSLVPYHKRQHLFVHDIADELWQKGKPLLEAAGYVCEKIDLVNPTAGIRYDVQSFLDFNSIHYKSSLKALTHGLIAPEPNSRQPHFVDFARIMLEDVLTLNQLEGAKRSVPECIDELMSRKKREALLKRMEKHHYDFNAMDIFSRMKGDEGIGMESTTLRKLEPWRLPAIHEISKVERTVDHPCGWSFEEMLTDDRPCALFVRTGLAPGGGDFARAVFMNLINTIRRHWDETGLEHPRGIQAFVDEFARLGTCSAIIDGHNELRKAGYSQWLGILSFAAMEELYGKGAKTLFNGCDHIILPGNGDMEVNETYSRMIGDMTIESGSRNESDYGESSGKNEQARRRIKADELRRADETVSFATIGNLNVKGLSTFYLKRGVPVLR